MFCICLRLGIEYYRWMPHYKCILLLFVIITNLPFIKTDFLKLRHPSFYAVIFIIDSIIFLITFVSKLPATTTTCYHRQFDRFSSIINTKFSLEPCNNILLFSDRFVHLMISSSDISDCHLRICTIEFNMEWGVLQ